MASSSTNHIALFINPTEFNRSALRYARDLLPNGGKVDLMLVGLDQSLSSAQAVTLYLYEAAFQDFPSTIDATVFLRYVNKHWNKKLAYSSEMSSEYNAELLALDGSDSQVVNLLETTQAKENATSTVSSKNQYPIVAVGGTFDHLHYGHKLLLTLAGWVAASTLIVGITGEKLLQNKKYAEHLDSYPVREKAVTDFLSYIYPTLRVRAEPINDIYGPTGTESNIDALVVSEETSGGAQQVNEFRESKGWEALTIVKVGLIGGEASKLSSTDLRLRDSQARAKKDAQL